MGKGCEDTYDSLENGELVGLNPELEGDSPPRQITNLIDVEGEESYNQIESVDQCVIDHFDIKIKLGWCPDKFQNRPYRVIVHSEIPSPQIT